MELYTMKVFGKGGSPYDSDYFAAIEDAIILGADVVNLSLGSVAPGRGTHDIDAFEEIMDDLTASDTVVAISAGNSGPWAEMAENGGYLYADDVSLHTVGQPGSFTNSLAVASVENDGMVGYYVTVGGQMIVYNEDNRDGQFTNQLFRTIAGEHEYIFIDGVGKAEDWEAVADVLPGRIALCSRGETNFVEKATLAVEAGAKAVFIYNNQSGMITLDLTEYTYSNPVAAISQVQGAIIRAASTPVTDENGKVKVELFDDPDRTGSYTAAFTLHNLDDTDKKITLSGDFFTQALLSDGEFDYMDYTTAMLAMNVQWNVGGIMTAALEPDGCDFNGDGQVNTADGQALLDYVTGLRTALFNMDKADVDGDGDVDSHDAYVFLKGLTCAEAILPAGGSVDLSVTFSLSTEARQMLESSFPNGGYIQGFLFADVENDTLHSIPVLGFYGNWTDPSMFDVGRWTTFATGEDTRIPYIGRDRGNDFKVMYDWDPGYNYSFGGNPIMPDAKYMPERNVMNSDDTMDGVSFIAIRHADQSRVQITNETTGKTIMDQATGAVNMAYYYGALGWQNSGLTLTTNFSLENEAEGDEISMSFTLIPEYYMDAEGMVDFDALGEGASISTSFIIDNTAPELAGVSIDIMNNTMTVKASDNNYVAGMGLYNKTGTRVLAQTGAKQDIAKGELAEYSFSLDKVNGKKFLLQVFDYAMNRATYMIEMQIGEATDLPEMMAYDLVSHHWAGFDKNFEYSYKTGTPRIAYADHVYYAATITSATVNGYIPVSTDSPAPMYTMAASEISDAELKAASRRARFTVSEEELEYKTNAAGTQEDPIVLVPGDNTGTAPKTGTDKYCYFTYTASSEGKQIYQYAYGKGTRVKIFINDTYVPNVADTKVSVSKGQTVTVEMQSVDGGAYNATLTMSALAAATKLVIGDNAIATKTDYSFIADRDGTLYTTIKELWCVGTYCSDASLSSSVVFKINGVTVYGFENSYEVKAGDEITVSMGIQFIDTANAVLNLSWDGFYKHPVGSRGNPIVLDYSEFPTTVQIPAGEAQWYKLTGFYSGYYMDIYGENAYVVISGKEYTVPANGLRIPAVTSLQIGNSGSSDATFALEAGIYEGTSGNPKDLAGGQQTVDPDPSEPSEPEVPENTLVLGRNDLTSGTLYGYVVPADGRMEFSVGSIYNSAGSKQYSWYNGTKVEICIDGKPMKASSSRFNVTAGQVITVQMNSLDGDTYTADMPLKELTPAETLVLGENTIEQNLEYVYTAERNGTVYVSVIEMLYNGEAVTESALGNSVLMTINGSSVSAFNKSYEVKTGDEIAIIIKDYSWDGSGKVNTIVNLSYDGFYEHAAGSLMNPVQLMIADCPTDFIEIAAGGAAWYQLEGDPGDYSTPSNYPFKGKYLIVTGENAFVDVDGTVYNAENGMVKVRMGEQILIRIGNAGSAPAVFGIDVEVPAGHIDNPQDLLEGANTVELPSYGTHNFDFTAVEDGTVTVTVSGENWKYTFVHFDANGSQLSTKDCYDKYGDPGTVELELKAGESILVTVGTSQGYSQPGGTITVNFHFEPAPRCEHANTNTTIENNVDPTCTTDGRYDTVVTCADCGEEISRVTTVVPALGHSYADGECINCGEPDPNAPDNTVTVDITKDVDVTNGVVTVTWDPAKLTLTGYTIHADYHEGRLTFGYVCLSGIAAGKSIATLTFEAVDPADAAVNIVHKQVNNDRTACTKHTWSDWSENAMAQMERGCLNCGEKQVNPFIDVSMDAYYLESVLWAKDQNITAGTGNGMFGAEQLCVRAQVVTFLYRAFAS